MKIFSEHKNITKLRTCNYCFRILKKGIENKRGTCHTCNEKYNRKSDLREFIK